VSFKFYIFDKFSTCDLCRVLKTQRKIYCATNAVQFFVSNKYNFHNDRYSKLDSFLDGDDKVKFSLDTKRETAIEYFLSSTIGWRRYLMHHGDELIPGDKIRLKKMLLLHQTLLYSVYAMWTFVAYRILVALYHQLPTFGGDDGFMAGV
jgi:Male sterility protein